MLVEPQRHQDYLPVIREVIVRPPPPPQPQLEFALEGRSISLQRREPSSPGSNPGLAAYAQSRPRHGKSCATNAKTAGTFSPLQLRIDLHSEQGVDVSTASSDALSPDAKAGLSRRQRAQQRRRQEQQKPADEVVYQRRTRPKTPAAPPRTPLAMSTMSMPAAGQKFVTDESVCFNSAEEASAAVKRLLAKTSSSLAEERHVHHVTKKVSETFISDSDYLQDSFDFLHQRHVKNLSDVISRHQQRQQQQQQPGQAPLGLTATAASQEQQSKNSRKQVHIHQSSFYDDQNGHLAEMSADAKTFKSAKSISLSNNNSSSNSCDLDDAKDLQLQQQQHRRCERENSTSSVQSSSSSVRSGSSDNCNNNFCDTVSVNNKSNAKISSKSSTSSMTSSSTTTRVQQSFSTKKQVIKQSFSSSSQDFEDRIGIDVTLTPSLPGAVMDLASASTFGASTGTSKVKSKVSSSSSVCSASSDRPEECKQSVKTFKSKTVKKTVSDGKQVHTDVDKYSETAEEEAEGSPDKPVITFSHVSSEGSHQAFTDNIVRFDSSTLSSPSRSRSPSPLLEMPAPYSDLSKEIKRPPMEKA